MNKAMNKAVIMIGCYDSPSVLNRDFLRQVAFVTSNGVAHGADKGMSSARTPHRLGTRTGWWPARVPVSVHLSA